jgi:hypothetical protein
MENDRELGYTKIPLRAALLPNLQGITKTQNESSSCSPEQTELKEGVGVDVSIDQEWRRRIWNMIDGYFNISCKS